MRDMTHACLSDLLNIRADWRLSTSTSWVDNPVAILIFTRDLTVYVSRGTCHIRIGDMTYSYVVHDSFLCRKCLIHTWDTRDMTNSYVRHDAFLYRARLIRMRRDMTHTHA